MTRRWFRAYTSDLCAVLNFGIGGWLAFNAEVGVYQNAVWFRVGRLGYTVTVGHRNLRFGLEVTA